MTWIETYHRFADEGAWLEARAQLPEELAPNIGLVVMGTLYEPAGQIGTDPGTGDPVYAEPVAKPGFHVNAAWREVEMPEAWKEGEVHPATPDSVIA